MLLMILRLPGQGSFHAVAVVILPTLRRLRAGFDSTLDGSHRLQILVHLHLIFVAEAVLEAAAVIHH